MIRVEWGIGGVEELAPLSDVLVIVDVLSFSTSVEVAVARDALIFPYRWNDGTAGSFAAQHDAQVAGPRSAGGYSLSPASLRSIPAGTRLVLPSLNGAALSLAAGSTPALAGCLRNAGAVARAAGRFGRAIGIIAAGERRKDGSLRPALEDWLGAGAIVSHLSGDLSPEARAARASFQEAQGGLPGRLLDCPSGKELVDLGFEIDVQIAAEYNRSETAPLLVDGAYMPFRER